MLLLETLAKTILGTDPLNPEDSDPALIPEPMPNTSHAVMLSDIFCALFTARGRLACRSTVGLNELLHPFYGFSISSWISLALPSGARSSKKKSPPIGIRVALNV